MVPEFPPPNPALSKNGHSLLSGAQRGRRQKLFSFGEGKVLGNVLALGPGLSIALPQRSNVFAIFSTFELKWQVLYI